MDAEKKRLVFIDVLRGLAVYMMLECHVVHAVMRQEFKTGDFYNILNILNGFIAVGFLFLAGSGFIIAANRKADDYKNFRKPLWDYLRRLGLILLLAYALHLPVVSFFQLFNLTDAQLLTWSECDVLQTIVASSVFALITLFITPNVKYLKYIFAVLSLLIFILAPTVWNWDPFTVFPTMIGSYFAEQPVSKFPLFPWSGFFLAGAAFTGFFFDTKDKTKFAKIAIPISALVMFICYYTRFETAAYFNWPDWWQGFTFHSFYRTSGITLLFGCAYLLEDKLKKSKLGNAFALVGQESLLVYMGHLMIVYGSIMNYGYTYMLGPRAHWVSTAIMTLFMCVFFYFFSLSWNTLKKEHPDYARRALGGLGLLVLGSMLLF